MKRYTYTSSLTNCNSGSVFYFHSITKILKGSYIPKTLMDLSLLISGGCNGISLELVDDIIEYSINIDCKGSLQEMSQFQCDLYKILSSIDEEF